MAPILPQQYNNPTTSHHPYSLPQTSQLAQAAVDPKLAGLKVVSSSGRSSAGGSSSAAGGALLESVPLVYPPRPAADPHQILANVAKGLESLIDRGTIDARPSRQGVAAPRVGACAACREAKAKCSQGETCTRCLQNNTPCLYPLFAKRGRKRTLTPNMILLESLHRDVERAVALIASGNSPQRGSPHSASPFASTSQSHGLRRQLAHHSSTEGDSPSAELSDDEAEEARDGFETVIESPLAVLAHLSSLKLNESNDEESGSSFLPSVAQSQTAPESYFATGLYQIRADCEPMLDPILLGLLTEADLDRLVKLYFTSLHEFCWHLDPTIHTPRFLRDTSPFLTTALAFTAAGFCPQSGHLLPGLQGHAMYLSDRVFSEGLKSLEIVQAYCLLVHWAPIAANWGDDRRWGWLGQALRIATEIRMDKPLNELTFNHYNTVTALPPQSFTALARDRARSWTLLFIAEIALCVSTGRLGAIMGLNLGKGFRAHVPACEPGDQDYNLCAMESLNKVYAKALALSAGLQEEQSRGSDLRQAFNSSWQSEMESWRQTWQHASQFVRVVYQHSCTILLSVSLRFRGPVGPVLDECRSYANVTVRLAAEWPNQNLAYASNILVVNIAYAATLILRIASAPGHQLTQDERIICAKVSDALGRTGQVRPHCRTLGALHSVRIRTLLHAPRPPASASVPTTSPHSSASNSGNSTPAPAFTSSNPNLGLPQTGRPAQVQAVQQPRTPNQAPFQQLNPAQRQSPGGTALSAADLMSGIIPTAGSSGLLPLGSAVGAHPPSAGASNNAGPVGFQSGLTPPGVVGHFDQGPALWDFFGPDWNQPQPGRVMLPQVAGPGMVVQNPTQGPIEWSGEWSQSEPGTWAW